MVMEGSPLKKITNLELIKLVRTPKTDKTTSF